MITEEQMRQHFGKFGNIKSMRLKRPEINRNPSITNAYSIAYLEYEREEEAQAAITTMNGSSINYKILSVDLFDKSKQEHVIISG
jgi:RNA recognition motif-containing protein